MITINLMGMRRPLTAPPLRILPTHEERTSLLLLLAFIVVALFLIASRIAH